jgi:hypothetical protein
MSIKNKPIVQEKSSAKVADFLVRNQLHKKDFAQMIGVTLSYVYNLIDETIPFSSRGTTLERIAIVMDILPEDFEEYMIQEEPTPFSKNLTRIKGRLRDLDIKTVDFLRGFERKKRLSLVDILRGSKPIPVDYFELENILSPLELNKEEIYKIWEDRISEYLEAGGFNLTHNEGLLNAMFNCAQKYIKTHSEG